jgi:hypothetical protein
MFPRKLITSIAIGITAIAVAIGASSIVNPTAVTGAPTTASPSTPTGANNQRVVGQVPPGWQSGSGTIITGAAADQAEAVAVAAYPGGTVNRVLQLADGSYAVHQINISWPHHVFVSTDFQVTGAIG